MNDQELDALLAELESSGHAGPRSQDCPSCRAAAAIRALRQERDHLRGEADLAAGRVRPLADVMAELRAKFGPVEDPT
jgi:hypothetical protein